MSDEPARIAELVRFRQEVERQHKACDITGPQGEVDWKTGYKAALGWVLFRLDGLLIDGTVSATGDADAGPSGA